MNLRRRDRKAPGRYRQRVIDLREFRRACYEAARRTGGSVPEFRYSDGMVIPNFDQGVISYGDRTIAVVCMRHSGVPLLAVAEPRVFAGAGEWGPLTFVEAPEVIGVLAEFPGFRVLTPIELDGPLDPSAWPHLSPHDLRYWRPETLGEALFNYWD
jgi:hypothetical protein